jgi:hypothetical protein
MFLVLSTFDLMLPGGVQKVRDNPYKRQGLANVRVRKSRDIAATSYSALAFGLKQLYFQCAISLPVRSISTSFNRLAFTFVAWQEYRNSNRGSLRQEFDTVPTYSNETAGKRGTTFTLGARGEGRLRGENRCC